MRQTDKFTFFFGKADVFSNWHQMPFEFHGRNFNCVEQFMMYSKAKLFNDTETAEKIISTNDPKTQKALGRLVRNFDSNVWDAKCVNIVTVGCREKFCQNPKLLQALIATGDRILVEASPFDKIWGIGLGENHPNAEFPEKWKGKNLLGKALENTRELLIERMDSFGIDNKRGSGTVSDGTHCGSVLSLAGGVVTQRINREGDTIRHDASKLSDAVKEGEVIDIRYNKDGIGIVGGRGVGNKDRGR